MCFTVMFYSNSNAGRVYILYLSELFISALANIECASGCDLYCNFEKQAMSHSHCNTKAVSWTCKGIPLRD